MHQQLHTKLLTAIAVALAVAVMAPIGSAKTWPQAGVTIPEWLMRIQFPGTSSEPTVYMAGSITIPSWLAQTQYPGTSSEPTVLVNARGSSHVSAPKVQNGHVHIPV